MQQFQFRVLQIPRWQLALGAGLLLALLLALVILALGVFLLVLPVVIVAGALAYFFGGRRLKTNPDNDDRTIVADYRVIEQKQIDRNDHE
jgi:uncharacterized membrane protein